MVTGSSSGIGKAIALLFAREGAEVIVTYHAGEDRAKAVVAEIEKAAGKAKAYRMNVGDESEIEAFFEAIDADFGDVDIWVNNAGINGSQTPIEEMTTEQWDNVIKVNLYGPFFCSRTFLRMKKKYGTYKGSRIINVTSIHQHIKVRGNANYNAAKAGMRNLASHASSYVTGSTYTMDGALSILGRDA